MRCARCPAAAYTRTPHLEVRGRPAALCRACADAFERERRTRLCDECAERPAVERLGELAICEVCATAAPRFRAAAHAWLRTDRHTLRRSAPISADPWPDERW